MQHVPGIVNLLSISLAYEETQIDLAYRAYEELDRQIKADGKWRCPELSHLFAYGNVDQVSDYKKFNKFWFKVTNTPKHQTKKEEDKLPSEFVIDKESFLNEKIAEELAEMKEKHGYDRIEYLLRNKPFLNLMQKLRWEKRRMSNRYKQYVEYYQRETKWRGDEYNVEEEGVEDRKPVDFEECVPEVKEAYGEAKTKMIAAAYYLESKVWR